MIPFGSWDLGAADQSHNGHLDPGYTTIIRRARSRPRPTRRIRFGPDERSTEDRGYSGLSFVQIAIPGHAGVDRCAPSSLALALREYHAEMIGISWLAVGSHVIHVYAA